MLHHLIKSYKFLLFSSLNKESQWGDISESWKTIWIFASGWKEGWWSGAKILIEKILDWEITWVKKIVLLSNYVKWGVSEILSNKTKQNLKEMGIESIFEFVDNFPKRDAEDEDWKKIFSENAKEEIIRIYADIKEKHWLGETNFLSGWLLYVLGINAVNIHPWPLAIQWYWWDDMHWKAVHEKIWEDYQNWEINQSCVSMHYITDEYDSDKYNIVQVPVSLVWCKSAEDVWNRVNDMEHEIQWKITQMVINWDISWSWKEGSEVEINLEVAKQMDFPEWRAFGKVKDWFLQEGVWYEK